MRSRMIFLIFFVFIVGHSRGSFFDEYFKRKIGIEPGPQVIATKGEIWPRPQVQQMTNDFFIIRAPNFQFKVANHKCEILEKALQRYKHDLKNFDRIRRAIKEYYPHENEADSLLMDKNYRGYLDELRVDLRNPCESLPSLNMDEQYELRINTDDFPNNASLISQSIWGVLRGLETWSQLIYKSDDLSALVINGTSIMDFPRFSHRGLLIDTSRHFLPIRTILVMLDAMAMSKLNVLHWHIVDDQSFPYVSKKFPDLSAKGAYGPTHIYSPSDVQSIIKYAAFRGIRVIPEFDTPGHTRSWGEGYPELLVQCFNGEEPDGSFGSMNPIVPETYEFMKELLKEVKDTFPDNYIHLGGDEVEFLCWETNPEIKEYMNNKGLNARDLESIYIKKVIDLTSNLSSESIVWQEVFDDGVILPNATVVQIWKGDYYTELYEVTKKGYKTILSSCWYLDDLSSGGDWEKFYRCDPHSFHGTESQKRLVIGGEACMWGEVVDVNNVLSRVWPRACAAAEKLWSPKGYTYHKEAARRLEEHTCRMNRRKIPAQPPNGPGFCPDANFT